MSTSASTSTPTPGPTQDKPKKQRNQKPSPSSSNPKPPRSNAPLRGLPKDPPHVRLSKTVSWILRHGAKQEGLDMRQDGYVRVDALLANDRLKSLTFGDLQKLVAEDSKGRYNLVEEEEEDGVDVVVAESEKLAIVEDSTASSDTPTITTAKVEAEKKKVWWIRANQGHSIKTVELDLKPILSVDDIPTRTAIHGTSFAAWELIKTQGLSRMTRNHVHLAQGVPGTGVISGMRNSSQIYIYINIPKALSADPPLKFYLSANGVVLTEGDERGVIPVEFFEKVVGRNGKVVYGEGPEGLGPSV